MVLLGCGDAYVTFNVIYVDEVVCKYMDVFVLWEGMLEG